MNPSDLRTPQNRQARIEPLSVLPVFMDLHGKLAIVVGESEGAIWKAELLLQSGARLRLVCENPSRAILQFIKNSDKKIELIVDDWRNADFDHASMIVADVGDAEATQLVQKARAAGALVNLIDKPEFCQFQFGSIVNKSPLVIGISTSGAAPVLAQHIRSLLESVLPANVQSRAKHALSIRAKVNSRVPTPALRREYWQAFFGKLFGLNVKRRGNCRAPYLIMVSSADELTLRDVRALQNAEHVYLSEHSDPIILNYARREAKRHLTRGSNDIIHYPSGSVLVRTPLMLNQMSAYP